MPTLNASEMMPVFGLSSDGLALTMFVQTPERVLRVSVLARLPVPLALEELVALAAEIMRRPGLSPVAIGTQLAAEVVRRHGGVAGAKLDEAPGWSSPGNWTIPMPTAEA